MPSSFSLFHFCGFPAELQKSIEVICDFKDSNLSFIPNLLFLDGQLMFIKVHKTRLFTLVGVIISTNRAVYNKIIPIIGLLASCDFKVHELDV